MIFLIPGQLVRHPLVKLSHLFILLQMYNDHTMVDVEVLQQLLT